MGLHFTAVADGGGGRQCVGGGSLRAFFPSLQRSHVWGLPFYTNLCLAQRQDSHPWFQEIYKTDELLNKACPTGGSLDGQGRFLGGMQLLEERRK